MAACTSCGRLTSQPRDVQRALDRMMEPRRILLHTDMVICEIIRRVGYTDIRYFSQTYVKDYCNKQTR